MPVRVRLRIDAAISSTSVEEKDLGNKHYEIVADSQNEGGTWKTRVPAGAVDLNVTLRDVTTGRLLVAATNTVDPNASPGSITLKRNNIAAEAIEIAPMSGTKQGLLALTTNGLTAVFVSNPGTVDMEITFSVAGD
jgi:hypothetical protein